MYRSIPTLAAIAAIAAGVAATAGADPVSPKPETVTVDIQNGRLSVRGHERAVPGLIRLRIRGREIGEGYTLAVVELRPGRTTQDVRRLSLAGLQDAEQVEKVGRLVAGATVLPGRDYATRLVARDRRFVVIDVGHEDQQAVSFRLDGSGDPVQPGEHDASVTIRDDGFTVPSALPTRGLIRIANRGRNPHSVLALRIRSGLSTAEAKRQVRSGVEPAKIGTRYDLLGVVSGGTVNRVEARLPRGRYLLVSYYGALKGSQSDVARGLVSDVEVI